MNKKFTRRDFGKLAAAGIPLATIALKSPSLFAAEKPDSKTAGVQLGAQTYSFRDLTGVDPVIAALVTVGLSSCELFAPHVEIASATYNSGGASRGSSSGAAPSARENLRQWRLNAPMSYFEGVRKKFTDAGIEIYAYNYSFAADFTDDEIDRGFAMTKALGGKFITSSSTLTVAQRVAPFADKHQFRVAWHGHSSQDPNEVASTESFVTALGMSKYFWANLDIGHYVAWGGDPVAFIKDHHARISNLHLKDLQKERRPQHGLGRKAIRPSATSSNSSSQASGPSPPSSNTNITAQAPPPKKLPSATPSPKSALAA